MTTPRRRWTPETIQETLAPIVAELGRFPKPKELAERGLSGLSTAMGRNGGVAEWKARFADPAEAPTVETVAAVEETVVVDGPVPHEYIATRAYYLALEHPGADPIALWLAAERELATA
jgi:hypothetical protein